LDLSYHQIITEAAHNHLLQERLNMLKAQISCSMLNWRQIEATSKEDLQRVLDEHWMIYQAIRRRWNDSAKSLMENHIMTALEKHLERIDTLTSKK
ncbi:MAG: FCD domain-containing protein, partial [Victivallales bacterium]|nr:FCD domain-containing protein [Victivallales bacterium]